MAKLTPQPPADGDWTYRRLVERVVVGDADAWREFVERFSNLIFSLLWRYANRDQDLCADLYLYVIEGLHGQSDSGESFYRLRRYLASVDEYGGQGRLTTWLGRVTHNLVSDFFREQEGRKTIPRAIARLDLTSQKIFQLLYWDCLPEREAFAWLQSAGTGCSRDEFDRRLDEINRELKTCNRWSLYADVLRRMPALPLHPVEGEEGSALAVQVADTSPRSQPAAASAAKLDQERARKLAQTLRASIEGLDPNERLMLVCRFRHGWTAGQIARLLERSDEKRIYHEIDRLRDRLRDELEEKGFSFEQIAGGLDVLEGLLDEIAPQAPLPAASG